MGFVIAAAIVGGASIIGAGVSAAQSDKNARGAGRRARRLENKMDTLERNRQDVINPFSGMSNLSDMVGNPMANLQVSTEAAQFQAEEADIALANSLDTMRATGAGAGGATALAQGALRSKRGIAASIQQQEAQNAMARAQGEVGAQTMRFNEARRMQAMRAQGQQYMFETQENRDIAQLDRLAGLAVGERTNQSAAQQNMATTIGTAIPNAVGAFTSVWQPGT